MGRSYSKDVYDLGRYEQLSEIQEQHLKKTSCCPTNIIKIRLNLYVLIRIQVKGPELAA
jgi:hypothetical protein